MTAALDAIGLIIKDAMFVPPAPEPWVEPAPVPVRLSGLPIALLGIGQATQGEQRLRFGFGETLFLYIDSRGCRRALTGGQHDRAGLRSLFLLEERRLAWLWPAAKAKGRWDPDRAAEDLIADQGRAGVFWPKRGEQLVAEPAGSVAAHALVTQSAVRRLERGADPYCALALLQAENAVRCRPPLSQPDIVRIVEAVCKRLLGRKMHRRIYG
jgi:hypothetical protein